MGDLQNIRLPCQTQKKNICFLVALPQWRDYSRQFRLISGQKGPEASSVPPNSRYQQPSQNPAWFQQHPKYRFHNTSNIHNFTSMIRPTALTIDMQNPRTTPSMHEFSKISDQNPNLQLLFARIALTSYYKILFIKIMFTITRQSFTKALSLSTQGPSFFLFLSQPPACMFPSYSLSFSLPLYDTKLHIAVIVVFLCSHRFFKNYFQFYHLEMPNNINI